MLRGYLIRLTREYTDGGMDSHAEEEKDGTQWKMAITVIRRIKFIFSANVRSAVRVFTGEAGVIRQPPDAFIAVFAVKHEELVFRKP